MLVFVVYSFNSYYITWFIWFAFKCQKIINTKLLLLLLRELGLIAYNIHINKLNPSGLTVCPGLSIRNRWTDISTRFSRASAEDFPSSDLGYILSRKIVYVQNVNYYNCYKDILVILIHTSIQYCILQKWFFCFLYFA